MEMEQRRENNMRNKVLRAALARQYMYIPLPNRNTSRSTAVVLGKRKRNGTVVTNTNTRAKTQKQKQLHAAAHQANAGLEFLFRRLQLAEAAERRLYAGTSISNTSTKKSGWRS